MATGYIQKKYGADTSTAITNDTTGTRKVQNLPSAAGFVYDQVDNTYKSNFNGTIGSLVDTLSTQTITGVKTFTSPVFSGGTQTSSTLVTPAGVVVAQEAAFTATAGNHTHTASFAIPAGATILDILVTNTAVWDSDTSATMKVGISGGDDDCFYTGLDLKTIPAAGKTINFSNPGGANGASVPAIDGGSHATQLGATGGFLYKSTAQTVQAIVTDVNVTGVAGRTRVTVLYSLPPSVIAPVVT